jgi:integrase
MREREDSNMASLCRKDDSYYIVFYRDKKRQPLIYLGNIAEGRAKYILGKVEDLVSAKVSRSPIEQDTATWLGKIDDSLHAKLAKAGLIEWRKTATSKKALALGTFIDDYLASRTKIKHWTRMNCKQARRNLVTYFGEDRDITTITQGDAERWSEWLQASKPSRPNEPAPPGLAENTARRHSGRAKQFFKAAVQHKLIPENPFTDLVCRVHGSNGDRQYFVTRAEADKVLAACPSTQWKLVFALSRFGGLRCPSEHSELRVKEVNLTTGRMKVRSPKTEHLKGGEYRMVPITKELRPYLQAAIAELPKNAEYVVTLPGVVRCRGCDRSSNLGTQMARIIKLAGVKVWPKLFQNCRATREMEWSAEYGIATACEWIGNTFAVAQEHYTWATDHDFVKASGGLIETGAAQEDAQESGNGMRQGCTSGVARNSRLLQIVQKALEIVDSEQAAAVRRNSKQPIEVPRVGTKHTAKSHGKQGKSSRQYAPAAARGVPDRVWKQLPADVRAFILATVQVAQSG